MERISSDRAAETLAGVERFFARDVKAFQQQLAALDAQIDPSVIPQQFDEFHRRVFAAFEQSREACRRFESEFGDDAKVIQDVQTGFRKETAEWFHRSWIAHRARTKPHGFAGDFEMLRKLYAEATPARGLGGYLDLCILDLPLARAVRARCMSAHDILLDELRRRRTNTRILNIASGPCREYLFWPDDWQDFDVEVIGMDNDPKAIEYVEGSVMKRLPPNLRLQLIRYNALRTQSAETTIRKFGRFDIIYSVGLFDYLSDDQLVAIINGLRETLAEGGLLYIAFKDCERYDKTPYQWHLDWHFFQRTEEDCVRLFERSGIPADGLSATRDSTGIILNFTSRSSATGVMTRTDAAEQFPHRSGRTWPAITDR